MARPIVLSNGELHVGLNKFGLVHDVYFPYVGLENHSAGQMLRHRIGVWVDGTVSWLDDGKWYITQTYPYPALVGHTIARNDSLGIRLEFDDFVDAEVSLFVRSIQVYNTADHARDIRLFMHQAFVIGDSRSNTDTAQYLPDSDAVLHYRGRRAFIVSGRSNETSFDQHTVGIFGIEGREGTFRDAEDGELSICNVEHGRVDSTIRFKLDIGAHDSARVQYWIAAGSSTREALYVHKQVLDDSALKRLDVTVAWWKKWLQPAEDVAKKLDPEFKASFIQSTMIIKSQIDNRGAIIASTDSGMLNYSRDAYAYCWPRDGALVLWPLIRMGYVDEPRKFFDFCKRVLHPRGYVMHKYRADGALGSSWHPYIHDGEVGPPIQEDETALVLFMFAQFYQLHKDERLLHDFYVSMIKPMADFMAEYVDEKTGLPKASYDLWEEVYLTTTFTTAVTHAALLAASDLAAAAGDEDKAVQWRTVADDMYEAAHKHLYNSKRKAFYKGIRNHDGIIARDETIDSSSVFGAFMFGLFPVGGDELTNAIASHMQTFGVTDEAPALPRYENDNYSRVSSDITGNWWFIATLWLAQYYLEVGKVDSAKSTLRWVQSHMTASGMLSEQISPLDGTTLSVLPLTWSHAEYLATLLDTIAGQKEGR